MSQIEILNDKEYYNLVEKYYNNEKVQLMKEIPHHDSNRLNHCLKVSYLSYKVCKKLNLNYESVAKAGLLHDFYFERTTDRTTAEEKFKLYTNEHPEQAVFNAKTICDLTPLEENIIVSHMWPLSTHFPKYKESLVIGGVDKYLSLIEFQRKHAYQLSYVLGVYFLFITCFLFRS